MVKNDSSSITVKFGNNSKGSVALIREDQEPGTLLIRTLSNPNYTIGSKVAVGDLEMSDKPCLKLVFNDPRSIDVLMGVLTKIKQTMEPQIYAHAC